MGPTISETIDDGGPAFARVGYAHPSSNLEVYERRDLLTEPQSGMTLRDYFAAKAMQAIIAVVYRDAMDASNIDATDKRIDMTESLSCVSWDAYRTADAMLKARAAK